jgi:hypothetical protein
MRVIAVDRIARCTAPARMIFAHFVAFRWLSQHADIRMLTFPIALERR